jgi:hypothetical protein
VSAPPAIRDLSFEIAEGEIFGFLGPSGQDIILGADHELGELGIAGRESFDQLAPLFPGTSTRLPR